MSEQIFSMQTDSRSSSAMGVFDRWARRLVHASLRRIERGSLVIVDGPNVDRFGETAHFPRATVMVRDPGFYRSLVFRGAMGGAEAYMEGHWDADDLTSVIRIMALNRESLDDLGRSFASFAKVPRSLFHRLRRNSVSGSRRNIAEHYDLGNDFFELFLDRTMMYSSGIFENPGSTLEEASIAKLDRICSKLNLSPDDHVLEIGTGWGGFAVHAAKNYGCRVTTTTISQQQFEYARARVSEAGLLDRVEILLKDYRKLEGQYDKLVSIEMIEAVGARHLEEFMEVCGDRLKPDGCALIQAITVGDAHYEADVKKVDFIKRYIFPGSQLVSISAVTGAASRTTGLRLTHVEDFTPHYAETLRWWRSAMFRNIGRIRSLGLSERFLRMWEYYFCYCEAGFDERQIGVAQLVFEKPDLRRSPVLGRLAARVPVGAN